MTLIDAADELKKLVKELQQKNEALEEKLNEEKDSEFNRQHKKIGLLNLYGHELLSYKKNKNRFA